MFLVKNGINSMNVSCTGKHKRLLVRHGLHLEIAKSVFSVKFTIFCIIPNFGAFWYAYVVLTQHPGLLKKKRIYEFLLNIIAENILKTVLSVKSRGRIDYAYIAFKTLRKVHCKRNSETFLGIFGN